METRFNSLNKSVSQRDIDKLIRENNIIEVARELGLSVARSTVPCINRQNHVDPDGPPSMSFNLIQNSFKCWVCSGVGGSVIDLVMQVKDVDRQKAIEFLMIRSEIQSERERSAFFQGRKPQKIDNDSRESIFHDFLSGIDVSKGIELIAFASTKGGTGKSLVVNNISVILSLITRYIGQHRDSNPQIVELVDLDFGKPDQRLLLGIEPDHYIEDIFLESTHDRWNDLRMPTPVENLKFVSACPVRKTNTLYYMKKNEILYMLHNSDALLKLADFGGGTDKDTLDFLSHIKSKIFVINPDKASVEAVFNLILSLIYYPLKQKYKNSREIDQLLDDFRKCTRTGMTIEKLREELHRLDTDRNESPEFHAFYEKTFLPFRDKLELEETAPDPPTVETIRLDIEKMREVVNRIMFYNGGSNGKAYAVKSGIYRTFTDLETSLNQFTGYRDHLDDLLKTRLFGLIINKSDHEEANRVADEFVDRIHRVFSMRMTYLGSIPENASLRNISNYRMPFILYDPQHPVLDNFYRITDKIIGLKQGSSAKIIYDQIDFLTSLKADWLHGVGSVPV